MKVHIVEKEKAYKILDTSNSDKLPFPHRLLGTIVDVERIDTNSGWYYKYENYIIEDKFVAKEVKDHKKCAVCGDTLYGAACAANNGDIVCSIVCKNIADQKQQNNDGLKNTYYDVFDGCKDVDDFCMKHNINGFMFNILKAFVGIVNDNNGHGSRHNGDSMLRNINKLIYYANKQKKMIEGK